MMMMRPPLERKERREWMREKGKRRRKEKKKRKKGEDRRERGERHRQNVNTANEKEHDAFFGKESLVWPSSHR